jgi:hypothetical protein
MNLLSLVSLWLDKFYQITTKVLQKNFSLKILPSKRGLTPRGAGPWTHQFLPACACFFRESERAGLCLKWLFFVTSCKATFFFVAIREQASSVYSAATQASQSQTPSTKLCLSRSKDRAQHLQYSLRTKNKVVVDKTWVHW